MFLCESQSLMQKGTALRATPGLGSEHQGNWQTVPSSARIFLDCRDLIYRFPIKHVVKITQYTTLWNFCRKDLQRGRAHNSDY
jgi:hypothetical protein